MTGCLCWGPHMARPGFDQAGANPSHAPPPTRRAHTFQKLAAPQVTRPARPLPRTSPNMPFP
eukprot:154429-Chlamydomonas_euryale.AAC.1